MGHPIKVTLRTPFLPDTWLRTLPRRDCFDLRLLAAFFEPFFALAGLGFWGSAEPGLTWPLGLPALGFAAFCPLFRFFCRFLVAWRGWFPASRAVFGDLPSNHLPTLLLRALSSSMRVLSARSSVVSTQSNALRRSCRLCSSCSSARAIWTVRRLRSSRARSIAHSVRPSVFARETADGPSLTGRLFRFDFCCGRAAPLLTQSPFFWKSAQWRP